MGRARTRHGYAVLGATALLLAGCGEESTDAMGDDTGPVCADLAAYADSLRNLADTLGPDATAGEVQAARDQAQEAQEALADSISRVSDDRTDDVAAAWDGLMTAFDGVSSDTTLGELSAGLQAKAEGIAAATASIGDDLDCR